MVARPPEIRVGVVQERIGGRPRDADAPGRAQGGPAFAQRPAGGAGIGVGHAQPVLEGLGDGLGPGLARGARPGGFHQGQAERLAQARPVGGLHPAQPQRQDRNGRQQEAGHARAALAAVRGGARGVRASLAGEPGVERFGGGMAWIRHARQYATDPPGRVVWELRRDPDVARRRPSGTAARGAAVLCLQCSVSEPGACSVSGPSANRAAQSTASKS